MKFNYKYEVGMTFYSDGDLNCLGEIVARIGRYDEPHYRCVIKTYNTNKELVRREQILLPESRVTESIAKTTVRIAGTAEELEKIYNAKEKYLTLNQKVAFEKLLKLLVE